MTLSILFLLDMMWLGVIAKEFYAAHLGYLMRPNIIWLPALLFYLINAVGIVVFVLGPARKGKSLSKAILLGALYGLCTYGAYDLTNHATIRSWPAVVTIVDLMWGVTLSAAVAGISFVFGKNIQ